MNSIAQQVFGSMPPPRENYFLNLSSYFWSNKPLCTNHFWIRIVNYVDELRFVFFEGRSIVRHMKFKKNNITLQSLSDLLLVTSCSRCVFSRSLLQKLFYVVSNFCLLDTASNGVASSVYWCVYFVRYAWIPLDELGDDRIRCLF